MIRPAVFIDKDGTLVEDVPYNVDPARIALAPGAGEALRRLQAAGYALVVVSNQSGVARGYFPESALAAVEARIRELLAAEGAGIDAFLYCPHLPDGAVAAYAVRCGCRKPAPGLQLRAAEKLELDLPASWMVGDILDDVEAGNRAGCRTVLLDVGHETEWLSGPYRRPTACAHDLLAAVHMIVTCPRPPSLREGAIQDSPVPAAYTIEHRSSASARPHQETIDFDSTRAIAGRIQVREPARKSARWITLSLRGRARGSV